MPRRDEIKRYKAVQIGFAKDCEKLLKKYSSLQTFSYTEFAKIWQEMSFTLVFSGKSSYDEFRHYTEVFLFECKKHHIYAKDIYLKTGAFYLMYGLYYKQPIKKFVKIRLTKHEFCHIMEFVEEMKTRRQAEPLYVYCKMMVDDAFDFVYTQTALAPDLKHFKDNFVMEDTTFEKEYVESIKEPLAKLLDDSNLNDTNKEYQKLLSEYIDEHKVTNFMVFKNNILEDIKKIVDGSKDVDAQGASCSDDNIGEKRAMLKEKAMQNRS